MPSLRHCFACLLTSLGLGMGLLAQELPTKSGPEDLEAEAKKLMDELPILGAEAPMEPQPDALVPEEAPDSTTVERLKTALERARKKQERWEKLARRGVLSRAEAESCTVEVGEALAKYERTRVALLRQQVTELQQRASKGEADKAMVESAEAALHSAIELSASADKLAHNSRLEVARNNLARHQKLYAAGLVSRVQLQRAESRLQKIEAAALAVSKSGE